MKEKQQSIKEQSGGPGLPSIFDNDKPQDLSVSVASGPYEQSLPIAGKTVAEVREQFSDMFDIDPNSTAVINGHDVGEEVTLKAGERLMFMNRAGEKGALTITISNNTITAKSPEGDKRSMKVPDFMEKLHPPQMSTAGVVLPDGVKAVIPAGGFNIVAHQSPPQVYAFKWVDEKSPVRYGSGTTYRTIRIALPYLIVMAQFKNGTLCQNNECFFTVKPIESIDDQLLYPALLNCSKFRDGEAGTKPLSWICSQYVSWPKARAGKDENERVQNGIKALLNCLLETGFNESSENNEGQSWYGASKTIDKRISTIKAWEKATEKDPLFVLDVPWLTTGLTVQQMAERIGSLGGSSNGHITQEAMARIIFNHGTP